MAQFDSGEAPRILIPRGTTSTPMPPARPAAADRHDDRLHVGELRQDLARQQAAVAGDDVVVVERRDEDRRRIGLGAPARLGLGLVVGRAGDLDLGAERGDPARLNSGVCADTSTVASMPNVCAASATPRPWLPADAAMTRLRPPPPGSSASAASRAAAPRSLNEPVRCRFSSLSQTSAPVRRPSDGAGTSGVTRVSRRTRFGDVAPGHLAPNLRIEHPLHVLWRNPITDFGTLGRSAPRATDYARQSRARPRDRDHVCERARTLEMSFVALDQLVRRGHLPEAQAPRVTEFLWDEIRRLKRDKRAFIPAHNYQVPEVQAIADIVGDSFELAVRARDLDPRRALVVFCGVRFMAEGCHTLAPERPVYLPNLRRALLAGRGRRRRRRRAPGVPARGRPPLRDDDLRQHLRRRQSAVGQLLHELERRAHRREAGRARHPVRARPEPRLSGRAQDEAHVPAAARAAQVPPARVRRDDRAAHPRGREAGARRQRLRLGGRLPRPPPDDRRGHRAHPARRSGRRRDRPRRGAPRAAARRRRGAVDVADGEVRRRAPRARRATRSSPSAAWSCASSSTTPRSSSTSRAASAGT